MVRWRIEEKTPVTSTAPWREVGTYDCEESVVAALQNPHINLDRCSVTRWSSQDGVSEMEIMPARRWLKKQLG